MRIFISVLATIFVASSAFAAAPTVETLPSGVTVQKTRVAKGASPKATDTVTVHYRGTFKNGAEFDSSYSRNAPTSFPLNGVIPCWTQGVQRMSVGEKAKLVCPSETAYGANGIPGTILPNTTLYFEVELLRIGN